LNYDSVDDLRADALFRAGEPQDSTSVFWTQSLVYLNRIQQAILLGGGIAVGRDLATSAGIYAHVVDLPITDWWFLRKLPRGVFNTDASIETGTATATEGSATVTLSSAPAASVAGWRIVVAQLPTVPRVLSHDAGSTTLTLDAAWPEDTQAAASYRLFNLEYDLPADFLRFTGEPYLHSRYLDPIPVGSREEHDAAFPYGTYFKAPPTAAAMIGPRRIQLNSFDDRAYRLEFDYIYRPADLQAGGVVQIGMPIHYRSVLASGAAMLIAHDKGDDRAQTFASEFRETIRRMVQEHRKMLSSGSRTFGVHRTRLDYGRDRKGRIQPSGAQFLT